MRCGEEVLGLDVAGLENVVPIVLGGTEAAKRGVQSDHLFRHGVTCNVRIKTTIDGKVWGQQCRKPARVGPGSRCG